MNKVNKMLGTRLVTINNRTIRIKKDNVECFNKELNLKHPILRFHVAGEHVVLLLANSTLCVIETNVQMLAKVALRNKHHVAQPLAFKDLNPAVQPAKDDNEYKIIRPGALCSDAKGKFIGIAENDSQVAIYMLRDEPGSYKHNTYPKTLQYTEHATLPPRTTHFQLIYSEKEKELLLWTASYLDPLPPRGRDGQKTTEAPVLVVAVRPIEKGSQPLGELRFRMKPEFTCFNIGGEGNALLFGSNVAVLVRFEAMEQPSYLYLGPYGRTHFSISYPSPGNIEVYRRSTKGSRELVQFSVDGTEIKEFVVLDKMNSTADIRQDMAVHHDERIPHYLRVELLDRIAVVDVREKRIVSSLTKPTCMIM